MGDFLDRAVDALGWVFAALYSIVPSYGVAIILLTVVVRLLLFPLTAKQVRSMAAMQRVQPEIKRLQAQYKDDRQKLNEELLKFYQEHKINPLAGCLPLLAQMPVFLALFQVLRSPDDHIDPSTQLFQDACPGGKGSEGCFQNLDFLGLNLSESATAGHGSFWAALPYFLLVALVAGTAYFQQRQSMKRAGGTPNPQMQMIAKVLPLVFAVFSISLPSGLVLYFLVSNLWQIGQQWVIYRRMNLDNLPGGGNGVVDAKEAKPPRTKGGADDAAAIEAPEPKPAKSKSAGSSSNGGAGGARSGGNRGGGAARAKPAATSGSGRAQTPGTRPQGANRRKKRKR